MLHWASRVPVDLAPLAPLAPGRPHDRVLRRNLSPPKSFRAGFPGWFPSDLGFYRLGWFLALAPFPWHPGVVELPELLRVREAVQAHDAPGHLQWYVDDLVIDCDAGEFWKVVAQALSRPDPPSYAPDLDAIRWIEDPWHGPSRPKTWKCRLWFCPHREGM